MSCEPLTGLMYCRQDRAAVKRNVMLLRIATVVVASKKNIVTDSCVCGEIMCCGVQSCIAMSVLYLVHVFYGFVSEKPAVLRAIRFSPEPVYVVCFLRHVDARTTFYSLEALPSPHFAQPHVGRALVVHAAFVGSAVFRVFACTLGTIVLFGLSPCDNSLDAAW